MPTSAMELDYLTPTTSECHTLLVMVVDVEPGNKVRGARSVQYMYINRRQFLHERLLFKGVIDNLILTCSLMSWVFPSNNCVTSKGNHFANSSVYQGTCVNCDLSQNTAGFRSVHARISLSRYT